MTNPMDQPTPKAENESHIQKENNSDIEAIIANPENNALEMSKAEQLLMDYYYQNPHLIIPELKKEIKKLEAIERERNPLALATSFTKSAI